MKKGLTYKDAGINYGTLDDYKRAAQVKASLTSSNINHLGFKFLEWTRGESVCVAEAPFGYLGLVIEGLGTKNLAADALLEMKSLSQNLKRIQGPWLYRDIGICTAAMVFNDMITLGVRPILYGQYLGVGSDDWFKIKMRWEGFVHGTLEACNMARCVWGGGETPTLKKIIYEKPADLAGASAGMILNKGHLINPANIKAGNAIVIIASSGIHANGLSLARKIAEEKLPLGYFTEMPDGRTYGETLLDPTIIYVQLISALLDGGVPINYCVNITGHGWRKFMRASKSFTYVLDKLPIALPIFDFIMEHGPVSVKDAYATFNMGAGFALYVDPADAPAVIATAKTYGLTAHIGGYIEKGPKRVVITPRNLVYKAKDLKVR